jgi:osmotically-inducible protein OsmY
VPLGIAADEGVVMVRGNVRTYAGKHGAERAALRVFGVKGVAYDLTVRPAGGSR